MASVSITVMCSVGWCVTFTCFMSRIWFIHGIQQTHSKKSNILTWGMFRHTVLKLPFLCIGVNYGWSVLNFYLIATWALLKKGTTPNMVLEQFKNYLSTTCLWTSFQFSLSPSVPMSGCKAFRETPATFTPLQTGTE